MPAIIDKPLPFKADRVSQRGKRALRRRRILELERSHATGYQQHAVQPEEFAIAESDLALSFDSESPT